MGEPVDVRPVSSVDDVRAVAALVERVWGERRIITPELLRAMATHGNPVIAAFRGSTVVGAQMGFLATVEGRLVLHSHVTGVEPGTEHRGVGFLLKRAQRDWCLEHGIDAVTWTFDPMMARNAYFNLRKLGATALRFLRDFYGPMEDAFNVGERTDRLEVWWDLRAPRVESSAEGRPEPVDASDAAPLLDRDDAGAPVRRAADGDLLLVRVPPEYLALRERDRELAAAWRDAVADALEEAFERGYAAVDFLRDGAYVLGRR